MESFLGLGPNQAQICHQRLGATRSHQQPNRAKWTKACAIHVMGKAADYGGNAKWVMGCMEHDMENDMELARMAIC